LVFALLLFPDGKLVSPRWQPVGWLLGGACAAAVVVNGLAPKNLSSTAGIARPVSVGGPAGEVLQVLSQGLVLVQVALLLAAGLSLVVRFRRAQGAERQQIKWVALAGVLAAVGIVGFWLPGGWAWATTLGDWEYLAVVPYTLAVAVIPVAIGIAILRYRLYDIDRLISRTATYGALWSAIALAYVGLAVALGLAASERLPLGLAIVCTIIATLLVQPARWRLEHLADRWVFGQRLGGYELVARLGTTLEHALGTGEVAPRVAATVRLGLRTRWVRVCVERRTSEGTSLEPIGADGIGLHEPASPALSVPLIHADQPIGSIECGPKQEGAFQARDYELLETLGRQAALAIRNAALAAELAERLAEIEQQARELAASRTRIVQAEEAGRRRIERDIHDGVQQELVALLAKARLARNQLARDPGLAAATLAELQGDVRQTLEDLRELAHGIHPPVLSDRGLLEAIEAQTARLPVPVHVDADGVGRGTRYAAEIEGAAYFLVCEGLANALKHAAATRVEVRLAALPDGLRVEVADDGRGFEPAGAVGSGLRGLADRVEALGGQLEIVSRPAGGTRLIALLPAHEPVPA
jgi:signal transduction histidine kinase